MSVSWWGRAAGVERHEWPRLLLELVRDDALSADAVAAVLHEIWHGPTMRLGPIEDMRPHDVLSLDEWLTIHGALGGMFALDGQIEPSARPTAPLTLYRAAPKAGARGMSWTPWRAVASEYRRSRGGLIWAAEVRPDQMLAAYGGWQRNEFVIDPADLDPRPSPEVAGFRVLAEDRAALAAVRAN
jgi:hypothetical protein